MKCFSLNRDHDPLIYQNENHKVKQQNIRTQYVTCVRILFALRVNIN